MTKKQEDEIKAAAIFGIIVLLLIWLFSLIFPGAFSKGNTSNTTNQGSVGGIDAGGANVGGLDIGPSNLTLNMPFGPPIGAGTGGCCCGETGGGCPVSPDTILTVQQMIDTATAAANQIYAAGNATLQGIANYYNAADPLLNVTVN